MSSIPSGPRYPYWITEQAPGHRGPTSGKVLQLAVLTLLAIICWQFFSPGGAASQVDRKPGVSLCEEHQGRPGWDTVCAKPVPANAKH
jgi:hypothetical protein